MKHTGAESILYKSDPGVLVTSGTLADDAWYKINKRADVGTALPQVASQVSGSVFKTPKNTLDAITLVAGDEVWPLTQTEICKVDVEISSEMGVIETTDSCDYPYVSNIPDGYTNLSGSVNTMLRFDPVTDAVIPVSLELLGRFLDIVDDDGEGGYTLTPKDDSDILLQLFLNKNATAVGQVENWLIVPIMLSAATTSSVLKDVLKADYTWSKGQGPVSLYKRLLVA